MGMTDTGHDAFLAIARAVRDSQGYDEWNARFQDPVLREVYRLAVSQLEDETCRAHALPTWAAIAAAEHRSAQEGHPAPALPDAARSEPWTKTTGEAL